ncbi:hypothetical protein [Umezawaea sp.]|uniref:hypothetical protein n=1 Tax=Umezawaea sp. TaxID=1955258 RepID=UPI002ED210B0
MTTATTALTIVTLSSLVGVLTTPLFAFLTAAACTLVTALGVALSRAARTMDAIFAEELDDRRRQAPTPLKRAE